MSIIGVVTAYAYRSVEMENVHVNNSSLAGKSKMAAFIGFSSMNDGEELTTTTKFKNCSVSNLSLSGYFGLASFLGLKPRSPIVT